MIRIDRLTKRFGRATAVDDVSLLIPGGDAVALWGANGAGKSTIIRCVLGLLRFRGQITVDGHDVRKRAPGKRARRLIGYVPQEIGFYDDLGVAEAVWYFARLKGVRLRGCGEALAQVGLTGHERKRIRELSGGMKQRLALAIALLGDPPILVLDEVTASLDACGREELVSLLRRLSTSGQEGSGRTLLFASHRLEEVSTLARSVVLLEKGRMTAQLPVHDFIASLGQDSMLHLHIPAALREPATALLRAHGFAASLNGVGIFVRVPSSQKAAPFRVLADARIAVEDFEMGSAAGASAPHQRPTAAELEEAAS